MTENWSRRVKMKAAMSHGDEIQSSSPAWQGSPIAWFLSPGLITEWNGDAQRTRWNSAIEIRENDNMDSHSLSCYLGVPRANQDRADLYACNVPWESLAKKMILDYDFNSYLLPEIMES